MVACECLPPQDDLSASRRCPRVLLSSRHCYFLSAHCTVAVPGLCCVVLRAMAAQRRVAFCCDNTGSRPVIWKCQGTSLKKVNVPPNGIKWLLLNCSVTDAAAAAAASVTVRPFLLAVVQQIMYRVMERTQQHRDISVKITHQNIKIYFVCF